MKILKIGGIILLAGLAVFFGFHFFFGGDGSESAETIEEVNRVHEEELGYYRQLTAKLENELSDLKQEQYAVTCRYEARISELEMLLKAEEQSEPKGPPVVYTYIVSGEGITITGYSGDVTQLSVPSEIDGLPVVAIGRDAFRESALTEVTLPDSLRLIDWFAFYGSRQLKTVVIPDSVTKIEYGVFDGCTSLVVNCPKNSYAEKYARSYGMRVSVTD